MLGAPLPHLAAAGQRCAVPAPVGSRRSAPFPATRAPSSSSLRCTDGCHQTQREGGRLRRPPLPKSPGSRRGPAPHGPAPGGTQTAPGARFLLRPAAVVRGPMGGGWRGGQERRAFHGDLSLTAHSLTGAGVGRRGCHLHERRMGAHVVEPDASARRASRFAPVIDRRRIPPVAPGCARSYRRRAAQCHGSLRGAPNSTPPARATCWRSTCC